MKTTIEMAREAAGDDWGFFQEYMPEIHRLAELVRADERNRTWTQEHWTEYERSIVEFEREACAKLADEVVEGKRWFNDLPAAIRARGEKI